MALSVNNLVEACVLMRQVMTESLQHILSMGDDCSESLSSDYQMRTFLCFFFFYPLDFQGGQVVASIVS